MPDTVYSYLKSDCSIQASYSLKALCLEGTTDPMKNISLVVPFFNEAENIAQVHREIKGVCEKNGYGFEIIMIDDGSYDGTADVIKTMAPVTCIQFRKNFGQTAALDAGIKHARYEYIVTMDGDLQNDPEDIPRLLDHLEENNLDLVSGWRKRRKDPLLKKIVSRVANILRKTLINDGIHDSGCALKIYKKECFDHLTLYGEMHRFIPALLKIQGFKVGEVVVNHRPRTAGKTKYTWERTIKGFIDLLSVWFWKKFAVRPMHLLGTMGLCSIFGGVLTTFYSFYIYLSEGKVGHTAWPILSAFLILMGIQLFVFGLLADILSKNYLETMKITSYSIKSVHEIKGTV